jgi:hypothetical protein
MLQGFLMQVLDRRIILLNAGCEIVELVYNKSDVKAEGWKKIVKFILNLGNGSGYMWLVARGSHDELTFDVNGSIGESVLLIVLFYFYTTVS